MWQGGGAKVSDFLERIQIQKMFFFLRGGGGLGL